MVMRVNLPDVSIMNLLNLLHQIVYKYKLLGMML